MAPTATLAAAAVTAMDFNVGAGGGGGVPLEELLPPPQAVNKPAKPSKSEAANNLPGRYLRAKPPAETDIMSRFPCDEFRCDAVA